ALSHSQFLDCQSCVSKQLLTINGQAVQWLIRRFRVFGRDLFDLPRRLFSEIWFPILVRQNGQRLRKIFECWPLSWLNEIDVGAEVVLHLRTRDDDLVAALRASRSCATSTLPRLQLFLTTRAEKADH